MVTMNTSQRNSNRKVRQGIVCSDKMDKTITLSFVEKKKHSLYGKMMSFTKKLKAHDENNEAKEGDLVEIMETRPLSKLKCWRLIKIIELKK